MREVVIYEPREGTPAGPGLVYVCHVCGGEVPSIPCLEEGDAYACGCGNLAVDVDAGRFSVREPGTFTVERIVG